MKKSKITSENLENNWTCEWCGRQLATEAGFVKHTCAKKTRWQDRDTPTSRLAWTCWRDFYAELQPTKTVDFTEFVRSQYYGVFWRFADYCRSTKVVNIPQYQRWLLKNRHPVDRWASDTMYTQFLHTYLPAENSHDSVYRSVQTVLDLSSDSGYTAPDWLRYVGTNRVCNSIVGGHITAWFLYNCDSGLHFIKNLNQDQLNTVWEYIEPEPWQARFSLRADEVASIREILKLGGF